MKTTVVIHSDAMGRGDDELGKRLTGAFLRGTILSGADLRGANLTDVSWDDVTCPNGAVTDTGCPA